MPAIGYEATIEIVLRGPVLIHSSEIGPWGVDAVALRDPQGRLVLSGDAVQGKCREALDQLKTDPFDRSRGDDTQDAIAKEDAINFDTLLQRNLDAPADRYPIFYSDFLSLGTWPGPGEKTITQVAMDEDTGAAMTGMLRVYDCPVPANVLVRFQGQLRLVDENVEQAREKLKQILNALRWVVSFGSQKSVGFGRNMGAKQVAESVTTFSHNPAARVTSPAGECLLFDLSFLDPLCFPEGVVNGNIFETRDEIPGEALRGAVTGLLRRVCQVDTQALDLSAVNSGPFATLCRLFDRLRITAARPTKADARKDPVPVIPRSLAFANKKLFDFALLPETEALKLFDGEAAAFHHDWKGPQFQAVDRLFRVVHPPQQLRVRTAIDTDQRRAKSNNLFAYRMLRPEGLVWRASISIDARPRGNEQPTDDECATALAELTSLLQSGWLSVGKTKSRGKATLVSVDRHQPMQPTTGTTADFVITLRGPTLMLDPRQCSVDGCLPAPKQIDELYRKYWKEVSDGALEELGEHRFKQDAMIGGYQARRYRYSLDPHEDLRQLPISDRKHRQRELPYNPTLVVEAGSVFVLRAVKGKLKEAEVRIAEWLAYGLPLPKWAAMAYGDTHHTNIFLPENGFGEIDVNLPCHHSSYQQPLWQEGAS